MKIQYCSDLHLEFKENLQYLRNHPLQPKGDILLLAGDIVPFIHMKSHNNFFDFVSDHFATTYWVPGNHEYYHGDAKDRSGEVDETIRQNVFLVNNTTKVHGPLNLVFSTLWTRVSPPNEFVVQRGMSDFHVIRYDGYPFTVGLMNNMHEQCLTFLKETFSKINAAKEEAQANPGRAQDDSRNEHAQNAGDARTIVVTHHVPTLLHYPKQYITSPLNSAFAVELFDLIEQSGVDYWIFGHHHSNVPEFTIGKTSMRTNQVGYVMYEEEKRFDPGKIINI